MNKLVRIFIVQLSILCPMLWGYDFKRLTVVGSSTLSPVISSLLRGLKTLGVPHDFNNWDNPGDVMYVNSDINMLRRAINLKKQGKIRRLLAGPNLVIRAIDHGGLIGSPAIDLYFVNSRWTHRAYSEDMASLTDRLHIWFAGVDAEYWKPTNTKNSKEVLVYWKTEPEPFCAQVESVIRKKGFNPVRIQYGSYKKEHYKKMLEQAVFVVFISKVESQGIALLEAWSMDVPTLVWNPQDFRAYGKVYSEVSSCPYLTDACGRDWKYLPQLEALLDKASEIIASCASRQWVHENMTDAHSAQCMLDFINKLN